VALLFRANSGRIDRNRKQHNTLVVFRVQKKAKGVLTAPFSFHVQIGRGESSRSVDKELEYEKQKWRRLYLKEK
jgi:hypothetical protein